MPNPEIDPEWIPLRHGFVSIHPTPKGVVHFIGGYFFGTAANFWYKDFLLVLRQEFTVHVYSYSFAQLSHWKIANDLLEQIQQVNSYGDHTAKQAGFSPNVYLDPSQHCLVGHSLGCECIALIRFLSLTKDRQRQLLEAARDQLGPQEVTDEDLVDVETLPQEQPVPYPASLLMAPCFQTPTSIDWLLDVRPQEQLMRLLIQQEPQLLPLTSLVAFKHDTIASADASWLFQDLVQKKHLVDFQEIEAQHWWWTSLQYHMIPAFDPVRSGLASGATQLIETLVAPSQAALKINA